MLTPQTLQHLPDDIVELVNDLQIDIIKSISKKIVKADYTLSSSAEWQLYKASQLTMSTDEVNALIAKFTGKSKRQIKQLYTDACKKAINEDAKIYRAYGKDCSAALRSVALSNTLKAGIKNANGMTRNLTKSMVETSRATVTRLMDKAYIQIASGAFTYQEAIFNAVSELALKGVTTVKYPSGRVNQIDTAVRRAVMTGISQTAGQMQLDLAAEMDCDLVEVTSHLGARPSHALWQGKVYSISGKSKKYPSLREATGYGTGAGLKGWHCRHDFYPFFEGISKRASVPVDLDENQEEYELSQQQRAMERSIRKSKRTCAALDSAIRSTDDELLKRKLQNKFERHSAILKEKEKRLNNFCAKFGMQKQNDRVRVAGFNKSVSQKAVHSSKIYKGKQLDKSIIDGTIDGKKYSEMLNTRAIVDSKNLKNGLPIKGKPNSVVDMVVDGKVSQRRIYGSDGMALVDFDTHDHTLPSAHPMGAHKHIFDYSKNNPHGKPKLFTDQELVNNNDIVKKGVNYFDKK